MVDAVKLLHRLSDAFGPPGGEEPVAQLVMEYLAPCCQLSRDGLGSVMAEKPGRQERPRLMLAAHMDEVGFMVQNITPQGYLCLQALGKANLETNLLPKEILTERIIRAKKPWALAIAAALSHLILSETTKKKLRLRTSIWISGPVRPKMSGAWG